MVRYLTKRFIWEYDPTLGKYEFDVSFGKLWEILHNSSTHCLNADMHQVISRLINKLKSYFAEFTYRHQAQIDDEPVQLEILDTASQVKLLDFKYYLHLHVIKYRRENTKN